MYMYSGTLLYGHPDTTDSLSGQKAYIIGHFRVLFASVSKRVQVRNLSYENKFYSQVHSNANQLSHFHMKGFALGLGLKQRQKVTRKWPIIFSDITPFDTDTG